MNLEEKIEDFLLAYIEKELDWHKANDIDATTKFIYFRCREFYWTVTRWIGLAHLHDGTRSPKPRPRTKQERPKLTNDQAVELAALRAPGARVFVDVTHTFRYNCKTGIPRVVREIATQTFESGAAFPVIIEDGEILPYFDHPSLPMAIKLVAGDKFVMLDASWNQTEEYVPLIRRIADCGGQTIVGLHDLIPLLYPASVDAKTRKTFEHWLHQVALKSDAIVCVSAWSAKTVMDYLAAHIELAKPGLRVGWWPLGADFHPQCETSPSNQAVNLAGNATPFFLSVGTLESRKAHWVALRAFDRLWEAGVDVRYVVVGQQGWLSHALATSFKRHREYGGRLIWLDHANDADLLHYYKSARALIAPSIVEGFGLPVVEALQNGLPIIASDIAVFHEIGGESLNYFTPLDDESLALHIASALENQSIRPTARMTSWRQSADKLIDLIGHERYQLRLFPNARGATRESGG